MGGPGNRPVRQGCRVTHRTQRRGHSSLGSVQGALDRERTREGTLQNYKGTSSPSSYRIDGGIGCKNKLRDRGRPWGRPKACQDGGPVNQVLHSFTGLKNSGPNAETFVQEKKKKRVSTSHREKSVPVSRAHLKTEAKGSGAEVQPGQGSGPGEGGAPGPGSRVATWNTPQTPKIQRLPEGHHFPRGSPREARTPACSQSLRTCPPGAPSPPDLLPCPPDTQQFAPGSWHWPCPCHRPAPQPPRQAWPQRSTQ